MLFLQIACFAKNRTNQIRELNFEQSRAVIFGCMQLRNNHIDYELSPLTFGECSKNIFIMFSLVSCLNILRSLNRNNSFLAKLSQFLNLCEKRIITRMAELMQIQPQYVLLWNQIGRTLSFQRWAGLSGAIAIIFTVYIENMQLPNLDKHFVALANQINYIHALILMVVPLTRRPNLVSSPAQLYSILSQKKIQFSVLPTDRFPVSNRNECLLSGMLFLCVNQFQWIYLCELNREHYIDDGMAIVIVLS